MLDAGLEEITDVWEGIYDAVESAEASMLRIAHCLRAERECVTLLDPPRLSNLRAERTRLVAELEAGEGYRRALLNQAWQSPGGGDQLPLELPEALRALVESEGADVQRLRDLASELEALHDVVRELHYLNRLLLASGQI